LQISLPFAPILKYTSDIKHPILFVFLVLSSVVFSQNATDAEGRREGKWIVKDLIQTCRDTPQPRLWKKVFLRMDGKWVFGKHTTQLEN
jgi:hypothetical protein